MINKTNLRKLVNSSPMMLNIIANFSKKVTFAKRPEEYLNDKAKILFDKAITKNEICQLITANYQENVAEIYRVLKEDGLII